MLKLRTRVQVEDTATSLGGCVRHGFERATGACQTCREGFCPDCLVHPFGANKPGMCISCALVRAGIRR